jgi:hypothetical protein
MKVCTMSTNVKRKSARKPKKKETEEEYDICCVCGEEHGLDNLHRIQVKKGERKICKECASDIIHGLV